MLKIYHLVLIISVFFLSACSSETKVKGARVARGVVESVVSSVNSGTVRAEKIAELSFGTVGRVRVLNVKLGDEAKEGEILAELENEDLLSVLKNAQHENARNERLRSEKIVSPSEAENMVRLVDVAKAAYEKSLIRAPFNGIVTELNLEVGQLSQITAVIPKPLMKIIDLGPRFVRAEIDEVDLGKVHVGQSARIKILAVRREPFKATVRKVVPYISTIKEQDRTTEIELTIDSEGILLPVGASADIEVVTDRKSDVLYVPSRSLIGRGVSRFLFVQNGSKVKRQPVTIGLFNYDRAEIKDGVTENEVIILPSDEFELVDGAKVSVTVQ